MSTAFKAVVTDDNFVPTLQVNAGTAEALLPYIDRLNVNERIEIKPVFKLRDYDVFWAGSELTCATAAGSVFGLNAGTQHRKVQARDHRHAVIIAASGSNYGEGSRYFVQGETPENDKRHPFDKITLKAYEIVENLNRYTTPDFPGAVGNAYTPPGGYIVKQIAV
jgi:hypothetical protein